MRDGRRIGIIGLGAMGHQHTRAIQAGGEATVVAGCDVSPVQRDRWRSIFGMPESSVYENSVELLDHEQLDVVIVATHASAHREAVVAAARHGIHVLCEKPLALDLIEADAMVEACEVAGVALAVNHIKRGSLGSDIARNLLNDGVVGQPYLVRGEAKGRRWAGSELMEMGTHLFDWLRTLFGDVDRLYAEVEQAGRKATAADIVHSLDLPYPERDCGLVLGQRAFCSVTMRSGLHADIGFLWQPTDADVGYGFDIVGPDGTLALRQSVESRILLQRGHHRGPLGASDWEEILVDETEGMELDLAAADSYTRERLSVQWRLIRNFLGAIHDGAEPPSSGRDGRAALELVMAVWRSARTGQPVHLPLEEREHPLESWRLDDDQARAATPSGIRQG
jgi:predicted dehydrogenase